MKCGKKRRRIKDGRMEGKKEKEEKRRWERKISGERKEEMRGMNE